MLNLKKTAVAVLALGSSAVFAGSMGPVCSAVNVTVPCESTAWSFGAKALYLKPSADSALGTMGFAGISGAQSALAASGLGLGLQPNYNWGFQIEGAYHFNTGNDLNLNWYHLNKSSHRTTGAGAPFTIASTIASQTITPISNYESIDPKWDAVNIEVGQHVDFGDNKAIRFHGGAQYARIANNVVLNNSNTFATTLNTVEPRTTTITTNNRVTYNPTYNGFGPRVGADMSYDWGNGLGIYANGATALLAGTRAASGSFADVSGTVFTFNKSVTTVVPVMDAKLGMTYNYAMAQGDLTLDAGWMWVNYFNAHHNIEGQTSDFGLQGLFFGGKWTGNVA